VIGRGEGVAQEPGRFEVSFGELLRMHRAANGLSHKALSARSGISVDAISMLERGVRSTPRNSTVLMLADALRLKSPEHDAFFAAASRRAGPPQPLRVCPPDSSLDSTPVLTPHFAGRQAELAQIRHRLGLDGHLTVHGPDGVGKTQLVLRYLAQTFQ